MHELGIVVRVIEQVENVAKENNVEEVVGLTLEVGEVSGIVPDLFTDCFEWSKKKSEYLKNCELQLVVLEALSYCKNCGETYKTTEYAKQCPHCASTDTYLVSGNEVTIKDIAVKTA